MGSNIWPIAGVVWAILVLPIAAGTGALTGWIVRRRDPAMLTPALVITGIVVGLAIIVVMGTLGS